jgi:hypothetical protein
MIPMSSSIARLLLALAAGACVVSGAAAETSKVYVLVSAIGGEITVVRQYRGIGATLEPYKRYTVPVPGPDIDAAVLRGLDRAVASEDPDSTRIFMRLSPEAVRGVAGYQRGQVLSGKALAALEANPERMKWHRIILVAPRFLNPGVEGMGSKLQGIGIFVQPIGRGRMGAFDDGINTAIDPDTISPTGEKNPSYRYVAPYFYAQLWVIDAKTMKVLETNERYDFQRMYDPDSPALDVAQTIPPEVLSGMMEKFVERASARALNDQQGEVIIKEPRIVDPAPRK